MRKSGTESFGPGLFVAGTDTGVGKTLVTAALARGLRARDIAAVPAKPVHTGCPTSARQSTVGSTPDLDFCLEALPADKGVLSHYERLCLYRFPHPCSPHLAARLARRNIDPARIAEGLRSLAEQGFFVVAEGVGGLMVPLTEYFSVLDLIATLRWPVVLVARPGLGTLNHTLLSLDALRKRLVPVAGVVFNAAVPDATPQYIADDNRRTVVEWGRVPVLGWIPHLQPAPPQELAAAAAAGIVWEELLRGLRP